MTSKRRECMKKQASRVWQSLKDGPRATRMWFSAKHYQVGKTESLSKSPGRRSLGFQVLEVTNHHRNVFRHGRMDVHRLLQDGIGRVCVHEFENRMNDFVTRQTEERGAEDSLARLVDKDFHEPEG